jgi:hypothetical protein
LAIIFLKSKSINYQSITAVIMSNGEHMQRNATWISTVLLMTVFASGCGTAELRSVRTVTGTPLPASAAPYNLVFTQFNVTVTRRLQCFAPLPDDQIDAVKGKIFDEKSPQAKIVPSFSVTKTELKDPLRQYVFDLGPKTDGLKTIDFKVDYFDSGALKSINGTATDETAPLIASVIKTVGAAVALTLPVSVGARQPGPRGVGQPYRICTDEAKRAVKSLVIAQTALIAKTDEVTAATKAVTDFTTILGGGGPQGVPQSDLQKLRSLRKALVDRQNEQDILKKDVEEKLKYISDVETVTWPLDGETFKSDDPVVPPLDNEKFQRWFMPLPAPKLGDEEGQKKAEENNVKETAVYFQLVALDANMGRATTECTKDKCNNDPATGLNDDSDTGLRYRVPVVGELRSCSLSLRDDEDGHCKDYDKVWGPGPVAQLGHVFSLPLKTKTFEDKTIAAEFTEGGMPTSLETKSKAISTNVATVLNQLGTTAADIKKTKSEAQVNDLQAKLKLLTLQKQYQDATDALNNEPTTSATADFTAEAALANAQVAAIQAKQALVSASKQP